jgi:V-type H+-transporting ATPase subunit a
MIAAICVPWLLISKPYLLWKEMHRTQGQGYLSLGHDESAIDDIPQAAGVRLEEDGRQTSGVRLEEDEGRVLIQSEEEEAVRFINIIMTTFD